MPFHWCCFAADGLERHEGPVRISSSCFAAADTSSRYYRHHDNMSLAWRFE